jgi:hypothetical protein
MKRKIALSLILCAIGLNAQEFLWQGILKRPEAEQFAFVKSFIADDLRKAPRLDNNERSAAMVSLMMNKGDTFIPLFVETIQVEMRLDTPLSNGIVDRAVGAIINTRSELALETIERLFRADKVRFDGYIRIALSSGVGDMRKSVLKWYKALESPNPDLRAAAVRIVQDCFARDIVMEHDNQALTEAMASRLGHFPEEADFKNDPLIAAIEGKSMTIAYDTRRKVLELSDRMRRKKESESKKQ